MAKSQYVRDLLLGEPVDSIFVVKSKQLMPFRDRPGNYLALELVDKTGSIQGRIWDDAELFDQAIHERDVVRVKGKVEVFRQVRQLRITDIAKCQKSDYDLFDLVMHTDKDIDWMFESIMRAANSISNQHLRRLVLSFLNDERITRDLKLAPASLRFHHNWLGGLLEHITSVLEIVEIICRTHPGVDRDLLITGAILHDIGKLREYVWDPMIDLTDEGKLLGHIILSDEMITERMKEMPAFPKELALRIRHMIISHHGDAEYGAPKRPMTVEAMALHLIENLDAQLARFIAFVEEQREAGKVWTDYERMLERRIFIGYESEIEGEVQPEDVQSNEGIQGLQVEEGGEGVDQL
ncbi:MAG: hypothetical protein GDYSWBUE_001245 [Candidatus Fervidibacterota bacterium]